VKRGLWIAGGVAGVAALGAAGLTARYLAKGCSVPPLPPPAADNVRVTLSSFHSGVLGAPVGIAVLEPRDVVPAGARRICFCLPGRGGTARDQALGLYVDRDLAVLLREPDAVPLTLVFVDGGESYWHARRDGEDRLRMLVEEVIRPRLGPGGAFAGRRAGIMGWSMGGYGALLAAALHPELFSAVCGVSAALWQSAPEQQGAVPDAFDDTADFTKHDVFARVSALRGTKVRIDCGTGDPFYRADTAFVAALVADGQHPDATYATGCHNAPFWQARMHDDLAFVSNALR